MSAVPDRSPVPPDGLPRAHPPIARVTAASLEGPRAAPAPKAPVAGVREQKVLDDLVPRADLRHLAARQPQVQVALRPAVGVTPRPAQQGQQRGELRVPDARLRPRGVTARRRANRGRRDGRQRPRGGKLAPRRQNEQARARKQRSAAIDRPPGQPPRGLTVRPRERAGPDKVLSAVAPGTGADRSGPTRRARSSRVVRIARAPGIGRRVAMAAAVPPVAVQPQAAQHVSAVPTVPEGGPSRGRPVPLPERANGTTSETTGARRRRSRP